MNIETGEIYELDRDQGKEKLKWLDYEDILASLAHRGITARHILECYRQHPHVIIALVRLRHEEEKELKQTNSIEEEFVDV